MAIDEFIQVEKRPRRVDVLHLSPPCQFFSPAHTREGQNDQENIDALYSCMELVRKCTPRIITLEQTFGITHDRHSQHFWGLIAQFTDLGYSVRWKVVRLCSWGSFQDRKRLIIIASAAGERLPPFPEATHREIGGRGLKKFATIEQAISGIRPSDGDLLHNLDTVQKFQPQKAPYDANKLAGTICTGSGESYHPSGRRDFTLREYACLQGFPKSHAFYGTRTEIKRQIGNAFPSNTVEVLYKHLHKWLANEDGGQVEAEDDVIMIDSDSDLSDSSQMRDTFFELDASPEMDEVIMIDTEEDVVIVDGGTGRAAKNDDGVVDLT